MTPQETNKAIAEWLGWRSCRGSKNKPWKWKKPYGEAAWEYVNLPDFYHTNAAFDLLDVLVERGCSPTLDWDCSLWVFEIWKFMEGKFSAYETMISGKDTSKSAAICLAIIKLIEQEKANERICR
jgi:hypothetical protein